jgi:type I restriction enzyme S subunit
LEGRTDPYYYQPVLQQTINILKAGKYPLVTVGELCQDMVHPAEFPREYSNERDGLPFVRAGDVRDGWLNLADLPYVSKDTLRSFPQSRLRVGDVLIVRTGAKAGEVAMFAEPEREYYASSHTLLLRVKENVNPRYLEQFLVSRLGKEQILRRLTGAAQRQLQKPSVASIRVPLPPRPVQDAIASKMDAAYRRKRELEARAEALLESIDGYVLGELGTEWGKPPDQGKPVGHEAVWFGTWRRDVKRLDPKRYRYQREEPPPKGMRRLGDLLTRRREKVDRQKYALQDLEIIAKITFGGQIVLRGLKEKKDYKGNLYFAYRDDLIYSKIRVAQGSISFVPEDLERLAVSSEYPVYQIDVAQVLPAFIKLVFRTSIFQELLHTLRSGATSKARVKPSAIEELEIPVPPLMQQRSIVVEVQRRREGAAVLRQEADRVVAEAKAEVERMILAEAENPSEHR